MKASSTRPAGKIRAKTCHIAKILYGEGCPGRHRLGLQVSWESGTNRGLGIIKQPSAQQPKLLSHRVQPQ